MTDFNRTGGSPTTSDTAVDFNADITPTTGGTVEFTPAATTSFDSEAGSTKQTLKDEASKLSAKATEKARGIADEGKLRATSALDEFSKLMEDAAGTVDEKLGEQYGQYA
ncbi:hypothetical protein DMC47_13115, partial [Nostoc sp. 3335mG]